MTDTHGPIEESPSPQKPLINNGSSEAALQVVEGGVDRKPPQKKDNSSLSIKEYKQVHEEKMLEQKEHFARIKKDSGRNVRDEREVVLSRQLQNGAR
jgi:hypothetical protein